MTRLQLHIYGPAFGLPSVDVQCLAVIALLRSYFDPEDHVWQLIPSNDPNTNPFGEFPALKDGDIWIAGFRNITRYIESQQRVLPIRNDFQFELNGSQKSNAEAYISFLESRALPLLDLSLYVSSDNYTTCTRSAVSDLLSWPQSWTIPQRLRDDARKRSDHLGLSGLDVDATREKELMKENEGLTAQIPKALRMSKQSVSSLLGSTAEQTRFRLEAVTAACFEPLEALLGNKEFFLGDRMTVLDCYALAILAQMRTPDLPQPWLQEALDNRYTRLSEWASTKASAIFHNQELPWGPVAVKTWLERVSSTLDFIAGQLPITIVPINMRPSDVGNISGKEPRNGEAKHRHNDQGAIPANQRKTLFHLKAKRYRDTTRGIIATIVSSAGLVGYMFHIGMLSTTMFRKVQPTRRNFGEAGALLGLG